MLEADDHISIFSCRLLLTFVTFGTKHSVRDVYGQHSHGLSDNTYAPKESRREYKAVCDEATQHVRRCNGTPILEEETGRSNRQTLGILTCETDGIQNLLSMIKAITEVLQSFAFTY